MPEKRAGMTKWNKFVTALLTKKRRQTGRPSDNAAYDHATREAPSLAREPVAAE